MLDRGSVNRPWLVAIALCLLSSASRVDAAEVFELLSAAEAPEDGRLAAPVTLDGFHDWQPPATLAEWEVERLRLRRQVLVAAGLWPMPQRTLLRPRIFGRMDRGGYSVEKVHIESLPGLYVTGNLWRPRGVPRPKAGFPAVLSAHGHWADGRFHQRDEVARSEEVSKGYEVHLAAGEFPIQARCAELVQLGCVVFQYDMIGYADFTQLDHRKGFDDVEAQLRLQSLFGLQTWNSIRAFDFLSALEDVDAQRIAVTGASGGGTQTMILCAIDERPAVGFPAVMVSTAMQGGCICENASHLRVDANNVAFAALAAPRPYGMVGANDWTVEILEKGYPELRRVWALYGKEDLVAAWCHPTFPHNYNRVSRGHLCEWINRHLQLGIDVSAPGARVPQKPFVPISRRELSVFDAANPRPADAVDVAGLRAFLTRTSDAQIAALRPRKAADVPTWRAFLRGALETILHTSSAHTSLLDDAAQVEARLVAKEPVGEFELRRYLLSRADGRGQKIPAVWIRGRDWNGTVTVAVGPEGKAELLCAGDAVDGGLPLRPVWRELIARGGSVLAPDVFLTGEYLASEPPPTPPRDGNRHEQNVSYTWGYNRTLIGERVDDLLTCLAQARQLSKQGRTEPRVYLVGVAGAGPWALLAAGLAGDGIGRLVVDWPEDVDDPLKVDELEHADFLPGARKYGGLPALLSLVPAGRVALLGRESAPPSPMPDSARPEGEGSAALIEGGGLEALLQAGECLERLSK